MKTRPNSATDQSDRAVALATFLRRNNHWVCRALSLQAIGFGSTKSEARANLKQMLVLVRASGVEIAKAPRHRAKRFKAKADQA